MSLSPEELSRYSRHLRLGEVGQAGQERLKAGSVLVVGLGGLGSPAALYLAAAGVGRIALADFDKVELHNLQRQVIHTEASVGTSKLQSAIERIEAINSSVELVTHPEGVSIDNAAQLFAQYDVILDGTDNFPTRYLNNDAAYMAGKPLVYGSIFQFEGQVSVFDPANGGPCYRCLFPKMPAPGEVPNCDEAGVFGALCGMVGSAQAIEVLKLIMGIGDPLRGRLLVMDTLTQRQTTIRIKSDPNCPLCGSNPSITSLDASNYDFTCEVETENKTMSDLPIEIDVQTAKQMQNDPATLFIDVRQVYEAEICSIEGSRLMPLQGLGQSYQDLPQDRQLVVYCHHGMRSLHATEFLRKVGYENVQSMIGGIDAWAAAFEPDMQRY